MATINLNGWQRIGVSASLTWVALVLLATMSIWNPFGVHDWLYARHLPFETEDPLGLDPRGLLVPRVLSLVIVPIVGFWLLGFASTWIRRGFDAELDRQYTTSGRLADTLALIQVLSIDEFSHRSDKWLATELQRVPKSLSTWSDLARQHPELFRLSNTDTPVSLISRHVAPQDAAGRRQPMVEHMAVLMNLAVNLHDRQLQRAQFWRLAIPVVVAVIAATTGAITVLMSAR